MNRVIVGTAGHIDHGKTTLVKALTGVDCDRWQEEKERGITIDLGFAHLTADGPGGEPLQIGFVDVPGHERFVHNALAGLGGIRLMMLVVAADEGVKPQTQEHLAICSLLDIPAGLVALSKSDLVDGELLELAQLELEEALVGTPFEKAPIVPVSATTGAGVPELREQLVALAAAAPAITPLEQLPARLPIDRSFVLQGLGTIVTGTLMTGRISAGDQLDALPGDLSVRVRSVQVHGEEREHAVAGERTSLQITGASSAELSRGLHLVEPGRFRSSHSLLVHLDLLPNAPKSIQGFAPVRFHLTSSERVGKMRPLGVDKLDPGEQAIVEIRLDRRVPAIRGDRFIVRRPSPQTTLGGGAVLDPLWLRRRGASLEVALAGLSGADDEALSTWVRLAGAAGMEPAELARRIGNQESVVTTLLEPAIEIGNVFLVPAGAGHGARYVHSESWQTIEARAPQVLKDYFKREPLTHGMPKAEAKKRLAPGRAALLADAWLERLAAAKRIVIRGDLVDLPGRANPIAGSDAKLSASILQAFEQAGLAPPSPNDVCHQLNAKKQIFDGVLKYLIRDGQLVRLPGDLLIAAAAVETLVADVRGASWQGFSVPEFKDRFGLTRKWAIPLLEHLDKLRVTRRQGDRRQVLR